MLEGCSGPKTIRMPSKRSGVEKIPKETRARDPATGTWFATI